MQITEHLNENHASYCCYDNYRSIASFIDGQKPSTRKIIYYMKNIKTFTKVDTLANNTAGETQYLHGSINLEGVIKDMCKSFAGSNNIPLLENEGYVGYRDEQEPGASRYVKAMISKIVSLIFKKEDEKILIRQDFEGSQIEPKYFLPIIPLILINGSEGIGQGFAHKILSRNPKDIINYILDKLNDKELPKLLPYCNGFKTKITESTKEKQFNVVGAFEVLNTSTVRITELPFTYNSSKYIEILNELEDKGIVKSYIDKSSKNNFLFELKVTRASIFGKSNEELLSLFKLKTTITENYTLLDANNKIKIFNDIYEILDNYIDVRLEGYRQRKEAIIKEFEYDLLILRNKFNFVKGINSGFIEISKKSKSELEFKLYDSYYDKIDDSYDYLLNMKIYSLTIEKEEELEKNIKLKEEELEKYNSKDIKDIWIEELDELMKALNIKPTKQPKIKKTKDKHETKEEQELDLNNLF